MTFIDESHFVHNEKHQYRVVIENFNIDSFQYAGSDHDATIIAICKFFLPKFQSINGVWQPVKPERYIFTGENIKVKVRNIKTDVITNFSFTEHYIRAILKNNNIA